MTGKQIVRGVLEFKPVQSAPCWLMGLEDADSGLSNALDTHYRSKHWRSCVQSCIHGGHVGFVNVLPQNGVVRDTFGVLLQAGNITHVLDVPIKQPDLDGFIWPKPADMLDWDGLNQSMRAHSDRFQLWGLAMGLFERAWFLRGMEDFLCDLIDEEKFAGDLLDQIMEVHLAFIDMMATRTPADAIYGGDDVCDQRGVIMGVDRWRLFFKPRLKRLIDRAHEHGLPYILHACGNVVPILDELIEIGLDGLESLQPEANDLNVLKHKADGKLALIGGMGVQSTMYNGTPDEIAQVAHDLWAKLGKGGGYILAPSKALEHEPVENAAALVDVMMELQEVNMR